MKKSLSRCNLVDGAYRRILRLLSGPLLWYWHCCDNFIKVSFSVNASTIFNFQRLVLINWRTFCFVLCTDKTNVFRFSVSAVLYHNIYPKNFFETLRYSGKKNRITTSQPLFCFNCYCPTTITWNIFLFLWWSRANLLSLTISKIWIFSRVL